MAGLRCAHCAHDCPCTGQRAGRRSRARTGTGTGAVIVRVTLVLTGGAVAVVLLLVVRDIVTTVAGTGLAGLILKALLTPSGRRDK